jgi:hypothetical protein
MTRYISRRSAAVAVLAGTVSLVLAGCGDSDHDMSGMGHNSMTASPSMPMSSPSMAGMDHGGMNNGGMDMPAGDGLAATAEGFTLTPVTTALTAGGTDYKFKIVDSAGNPVTSYEVEQTKKLHFYLIRSDLTGFQHVHPTLAADGTWSAPLAATQPGDYRVYTSFTAKNGAGESKAAVLGQAVKAPGTAATVKLPATSTTTKVDGYTLTVRHEPMSGMAHPLSIQVTENGKPVKNLQPYLDTYAHVTAFHNGDLALTHLHPEGTAKGNGGPDLEFEATFAKTGDYRLFIQFQTGGKLHTAAITLRAG